MRAYNVPYYLKYYWKQGNYICAVVSPLERPPLMYTIPQSIVYSRFQCTVCVKIPQLITHRSAPCFELTWG